MAGRPAFKPTDEERKMVESLAGYGIIHREICLLIINPQTGKPLDVTTLEKHFRAELDSGAVKANAKIVESLYRNAVQNNNPTAQIWWTKCRMGWKDTTVHEGQLMIKIVQFTGHD